MNIQVRGEVVRADDLSNCPFRDLVEAENPLLDLDRPEQFCRIDGEIYLADYGNLAVQQAIRKKYSRVSVQRETSAQWL